MRSRLFALVLGCGLVAAALTPATACQYQANAADDQAPQQQTAQAQQSPDASTQQ